MLLKISHTTNYSYDAPVVYALQQMRLTPLSSAQQDVKSWDIDIEGGRIQAGYIDHHGNQTELVSVDEDTQHVTITAHGEVDTADTAGITGKVNGAAPLWYYQQATALTEPGQEIGSLGNALAQNSDRLSALHALSGTIRDMVPYSTDNTYVATTAEEALLGGSGVCQDHAQIFIAAARVGGIPARYASGYLMINGQTEQEASHAWAEAWLDELGWVGFDVSNGVAPDDRYVRIATGRDYRDAAPLSGMRIGNATESMIVSLQVQQ
jgi:transglutaminase-like putative cysteine protease